MRSTPRRAKLAPAAAAKLTTGPTTASHKAPAGEARLPLHAGHPADQPQDDPLHGDTPTPGHHGLAQFVSEQGS